MSTKLHRVRALPLGNAVPLPRTGPTGHATGKASAEMQAESDAWRDAQPVVTSCVFCGWSFNGTAGDARVEALNHRQMFHPEALVRRPRRRGGWAKRGTRSASVEAQIEVEAREARRARAEREDAERLAKVLRGQARGEAA